MSKQATVTEQAWIQIWERYPSQVREITIDLATKGDLASLRELATSGILRQSYLQRDFILADAALPLLSSKAPAAKSAEFLDDWFETYDDARAAAVEAALMQTQDACYVEPLFKIGARMRSHDERSRTALGAAWETKNYPKLEAILRSCNSRDLAPLVDGEHSIFDTIDKTSLSDYGLALFEGALGERDKVCPTFRACAAAVLEKTDTSNGREMSYAILVKYAEFTVPAHRIEARSKIAKILQHPPFYTWPIFEQVIKNLMAHGVDFSTNVGNSHPVAMALTHSEKALAILAEAGVTPPAKQHATTDRYTTLVSALKAKKAIDAVVTQRDIDAILNGTARPKRTLRAA